MFCMLLPLLCGTAAPRHPFFNMGAQKLSTHDHFWIIAHLEQLTNVDM